MILYSYFRSSASYRVRIALRLKGLNFEYRPVHLLKEGGQHTHEEFKKLNPMAQLPALQLDSGLVINQSMAILQYIDDIAPNPHRLFPKDPIEKAKVIEICEIVNSGIHPPQNLKVLKYAANFGAEKAEWAHHWIQEGFIGLEKRLAEFSGEYSVGDELSAADLFVIPQVFNAHRFKVDMRQFPCIDRIEKRCLTLEAFQRSSPANQPDSES